ncbi:hypothetical protein Tco_0907614 [Tanacetum coccineum]|uniref:Uncharacterized protein n=1 Tax=Tanacetum coccineum TaxID=301880 RepID=A0ABQ5CR83_9ASTR
MLLWITGAAAVGLYHIHAAGGPQKELVGPAVELHHKKKGCVGCWVLCESRPLLMKVVVVCLPRPWMPNGDIGGGRVRLDVGSGEKEEEDEILRRFLRRERLTLGQTFAVKYNRTRYNADTMPLNSSMRQELRQYIVSHGLQLGLEWLGEDEVSEGGGGGVLIPNGVGGSSCWDKTCL